LTYVALLRAINLAGQNRVAMSALRDFAEALHLEEPRTLLQSGNLVFRSRSRADALERQLEAEVQAHLGVDVDFFVRSASEWESIVARNPFRSEAKRDPGHLVAVLLKDAPDAKRAKALQSAIVGREIVRVDGRQAYIVFPDGMGRSRLTSTLIEKTLGTRGTARNWNTVVKLGLLMAAI
jgi:uncharacterized protein (DUF1697 family)